MDRNERIKVGAWFLCIQNGIVGIWALFFPASFFSGFPGYGGSWVAALGDFNQHLVTDIGAFSLAFALLLGVAAYAMDPRLIAAAAGSYLVFAVPHLSYHVFNHGTLEPFDVALQNLALVLVVAVAGATAWAGWVALRSSTEARNE